MICLGCREVITEALVNGRTFKEYGYTTVTIYDLECSNCGVQFTETIRSGRSDRVIPQSVFRWPDHIVEKYCGKEFHSSTMTTQRLFPPYKRSSEFPC